MEQKQGIMLIDTDVLINLFDPNKAGHAVADLALSTLMLAETELFVSIITEIELLQGSKPASEKRKLLKQLEVFENLSVTENISITAKELIIKYSSSYGLLLGDSLIAATAIEANIPLFTFNKKDFRFIDGLNLYEY